MASHTTIMSLLRREFAPVSWRASVAKSGLRAYSTHALIGFPSSRRRAIQQRQFPTQNVCLNQIQSFSNTLQRRYPGDSDTFDPSQIERESDSVDVCIVGGERLTDIVFVKYFEDRPRRSRRSYTAQENRKRSGQ
ncbi:hypothetical protein PABG_11490 [Paracoccidioides brasiliensis Pb03]|nr:hypothetical protein PABG_11490 [Paracoccidioides brasiliensis Pb03]